MEPNEYQIGGDHYQKEYQHWDFVPDVNMPYHLGCATKYIARHGLKGDLEEWLKDLRKSLHYIAKAEDRECFMPSVDLDMVRKFCSQYTQNQSLALRYICVNRFDDARRIIHKMIEGAEEEIQQAEISLARGRDGV